MSQQDEGNNNNNAQREASVDLPVQEQQSTAIYDEEEMEARNKTKQEEEEEDKQNNNNNQNSGGNNNNDDDDEPIVVDDGMDLRQVAAEAVEAARQEEQNAQMKDPIHGLTGMGYGDLDDTPAPVSVNPFWALTGIAISIVGLVVFIAGILWLIGLEHFYPSNNKGSDDQRKFAAGGWIAVASVLLVVGFILTIVGGVIARLWTVTEKLPVEEEDGGEPTATQSKDRKYTSGVTCIQIVLRLVLWIVLLILFAGLLFLSAVGIAIFIASRTVPNYAYGSGGIGTATLNHRVRIIRGTEKRGNSDGYAIPEIVAETERDAFFGLGFVHAQDRLGQMELLRLLAAGKLSKYVGPGTIEVDKTARTLGFVRQGRENCGFLSAGNRSNLEAYVNGVNEYRRAFPNERPPEFLLLGRLLFLDDLEGDFTTDDVCAIAVAIQFAMSNSGFETPRWKLFAKDGLSHAAVDELLPLELEDDETRAGEVETPGSSIIPSTSVPLATKRQHRRWVRDAVLKERELYDTVMVDFRESSISSSVPKAKSHAFSQMDNAKEEEKDDKKKKQTKKKKSSFGFTEVMMKVLSSTDGKKSGSSTTVEDLFGKFGGSNCWFTRQTENGNVNVVGGSDPHLNINAPLPWYLTRASFYDDSVAPSITSPRTVYRLNGVSIPGLPAMMLGKNDFVAWGVTLSYSDLNDFYVMVPSPRRPRTHYMHNGQEKRYLTRTELIEVRAGSDEEFTVYESLYGPDVSDVFELSSHHRISLKSQACNVDDPTSLAAMMTTFSPRLQNVETIQSILRTIHSPGLGICSGDQHGTIGWSVTGRHADRRSHLTGFTGRYPILGNGSYDYAGYVDDALRPEVRSTTDGTFVHSANHRISEAGWTVSGSVSVPPTSFDFVPSHRGQRISEVLSNPSTKATEIITHQTLQRDQTSMLWHAYIAPRLGANTTDAFGSAFKALLTPNGQAMLTQMLTTWQTEAKYQANVGRIEPTLLWRWLVAMSSAVTPDIRRSSLSLTSWRVSVYPVRRILGITAANPSAPIEVDPLTTARCRNSGFATPLAGSADQPLQSPSNCVQLAAREWNKIADSFPSAGKWGKDNSRLTVTHLLFHAVPVFRGMADFTMTKGGDSSSVDFAYVPGNRYHTDNKERGGDLDESEAKPFDYDVAPSVRFVYKFIVGNVSAAEQYYGFPGGQSGHLWSRFYRDLAFDTFSETGKNTSNSAEFYLRSISVAPRTTPQVRVLFPGTQVEVTLLNNFSVPDGFIEAKLEP